MTKLDFLKNAKPLTSDSLVGVLATPRTFSTGSVGWGYNGKVQVPVGDGQSKAQVGLNMTVVGSKELSAEQKDAFLKNALTLSNQALKGVLANPRLFSTGSIGWGFNGKVAVEVAGSAVRVQVGLNVTIVGSKELEDGGDLTPYKKD